jgi:YVTN family beta-propeller protein
MNHRISGLLAIAAFALAGVLGSAQSLAQNAYIPNFGFDSVSVINTATNKVTATITDASLIEPFGVAVSPDSRRAYVANSGISDSVSVIDIATNAVIATIPIPFGPFGVAVSPDGRGLYVAKEERNFSIPGAVVVIDTATNAITATIPVQLGPEGIAVTPDGGMVYVSNTGSDTVSVISTATNTVIATIPVGRVPFSVAVTPDGRKVFVTNDVSNNVSVISTANDKVTATIGNFHGPDGVAVTPDGRKVYVTNDNSNNVSVISRKIPFAKLQDSILQLPEAGKPQRCGGVLELVILPNERRDTLAVAVCLPGRPGELWCRPDKNSKPRWVLDCPDCGGHLIVCRAERSHVLVGCLRSRVR